MKSTTFSFDVLSNHVEARTYSMDGGIAISQRQIKEISPSIDETLVLVLDSLDPKFFENDSAAEITISARLDHWDVSVSNLDKNETVTLEMAFETNHSSDE